MHHMPCKFTLMCNLNHYVILFCGSYNSRDWINNHLAFFRCYWNCAEVTSTGTLLPIRNKQNIRKISNPKGQPGEYSEVNVG